MSNLEAIDFSKSSGHEKYYAYQRYLELESIYLKSNKKQTIKKELRRLRK